jgi:hypothetical protein
VLRNGQPVTVDLTRRHLDAHAVVMVSTAAEAKPHLNAKLCAPAQLHGMPSIANRLCPPTTWWPVTRFCVLAAESCLTRMADRSATGLSSKWPLSRDDSSEERYGPAWTSVPATRIVYG